MKAIELKLLCVSDRLTRVLASGKKSYSAIIIITKLDVSWFAAITFQIAYLSQICPMFGLGADFGAENGLVISEFSFI